MKMHAVIQLKLLLASKIYFWWQICVIKNYQSGCNTGESNPLLHTGFLGTNKQYQCSTTVMGGWCRSPPLLINNTRDGKKSKTSILNTPSRGRKNMETFRVNSEKNVGIKSSPLGWTWFKFTLNARKIRQWDRQGSIDLSCTIKYIY